MSEPREFETRPMSGDLTTEQLANAGQAEPATAEPRTFDDRAAGGDGKAASDVQPIFDEAAAAELRRSWDEIQAGFVDEPRRSVEDADHLVAATMKRLAETFADERAGLEAQWARGDDVSTEDLRVALQRYRAFFGRLLAI
jgi:hypothetical protein